MFTKLCLSLLETGFLLYVFPIGVLVSFTERVEREYDMVSIDKGDTCVLILGLFASLVSFSRFAICFRIFDPVLAVFFFYLEIGEGIDRAKGCIYPRMFYFILFVRLRGRPYWVMEFDTW